MEDSGVQPSLDFGDRPISDIPDHLLSEALLLTTEQVAALFGVVPATVVAWRRAGSGPEFVRISGGRTRYPVSAIARWIGDRLARSIAEEREKGRDLPRTRFPVKL